MGTSVIAQDRPPQIDLPSPNDEELNDPLLSGEAGTKADALEEKSELTPEPTSLENGQPLKDQVKPEDKQLLDNAIKEVFDEPKSEQPETKDVSEKQDVEEQKAVASPELSTEKDINISVTGEDEKVEQPATPEKAENATAEKQVDSGKALEKKDVTPEPAKSVQIDNSEKDTPKTVSAEKAPVAPEKFEAPKPVAPEPKVVVPAETPKSVRESYEPKFDGSENVDTKPQITNVVTKKKVEKPNTRNNLPSGIYLLNDLSTNNSKQNIPVKLQKEQKVIDEKPSVNDSKNLPSSMKVKPSSMIENNAQPVEEETISKKNRELPDSMKQGSTEEDELDILKIMPNKIDSLNIKEDIAIERGTFNNPFPDSSSNDKEQALAEVSTDEDIKKKDDANAPVVDFSETTNGEIPASSSKGVQDIYMSDAGLEVEVKEPVANSVETMKNAYDALQVGQYESSINYYNDALSTNPSNKKALFGLATAYHMNKQYEQARETYAKLINLDPNYWAAVNNYIILITEENPEKAISRLEDLYSRNPGFAAIPAQLGSLYFEKGDLKNSARNYYNAIKLEPKNIEYKYNLAVILERAGNYSDAASLYKSLLSDAAEGAELPESAATIRERFEEMVSKR